MVGSKQGNIKIEFKKFKFPLVLLQAKVVGKATSPFGGWGEVCVSISSPSSEGGGSFKTTGGRCEMVSISSPSSEGGGYIETR